MQEELPPPSRSRRDRSPERRRKRCQPTIVVMETSLPLCTVVCHTGHAVVSEGDAAGQERGGAAERGIGTETGIIETKTGTGIETERETDETDVEG